MVPTIANKAITCYVQQFIYIYIKNKGILIYIRIMQHGLRTRKKESGILLASCHINVALPESLMMAFIISN